MAAGEGTGRDGTKVVQYSPITSIWEVPTKMAVPALSAAKFLAEESDWALSNLSLQKLIYLAHMVHLGRHGTKLIKEQFEAWDYGPVVPDVYHRLKSFGAGAVKNVFRRVRSIDSSGTEAGVLKDVYDSFSHLPPSRLVSATHRPEGAWRSVYQPGLQGIVIPTREISAEYDCLVR